MFKYITLLIESAYEMSNDPACDYDVSVDYAGHVNLINVRASRKDADEVEWIIYERIWLDNKDASEAILDVLVKLRGLV